MGMKSLGQRFWGRGNLWLAATRDAFIVLMPLTFLGLIGLLLQHLPLWGYRDAMTFLWGAGWPGHLDKLIKATHGVFGMALAAVVANLLLRRLSSPSFGAREVPAMIVSVSAVANFMLMVFANPLSADGLGHGSMLLGITVGVLTAELLGIAMQWRWLQAGDELYEAESLYSHAMRVTPAVVGVGCLFFVFAELRALVPAVSPHLLSPLVVWAQLRQADATWILSSLATVLNQGAWFLGIHGAKLLDNYGTALFAPIGSPYTNALAWRPLFNHFALMGGAGATLCLVIAILLRAPKGPQSHVARWSLLPALFNINESVMYGLPIVLNGVYLLPFLCVPLLFTLTSLAAAEMGFIAFLPIDIPWTTPPLASGWMLTGSWRGVALQCVQIAAGVGIYLPFVRAAERVRKEREAAAVAHALAEIAAESVKFGKYEIRYNQTGNIARKLLAELRHSLKTQDTGLWLAYQPKHSKLGQMVGVEALVRWTHPVYGPISPLVMVALTESSTSIHKLGAWVLEEACACKARWNAMGHRDLTMAVNLSPSQLDDHSLATRLEQLLVRHKLAPSEIELEITESAVLPNSQVVEQTLKRFEQMGVRLAMDDFGMGYSSLLYLRRFSVHSIKIDGCLTRDVLSNRTNADIIRTIVALGRSQKVEVVAEFVETLEQRIRLAELGCDVFQGYYHSPALHEMQCLAYIAQSNSVESFGVEQGSTNGPWAEDLRLREQLG